MSDTPPSKRESALLERIADLEAQLHDSEETLGAIRRGEIDALVVGSRSDEQQVYTLDSADRPYRLLIEQIQEGAVTLTEDGTILYCNRRLAMLLDVAQERVIGQSLRLFAVADQRSAFDRLLNRGCKASSRREITLCTAAGADVPVHISLSPLNNSDGPRLLCGVLTDLTDQKLRLGELALANTRLQEEINGRARVEEALRQSQKMEAVGQLTGGLAHDFNNLLTGINGALELLTTRIAQKRFDNVGRYVSAALDASKRAAALTHRLLAFSRRQTLAPKPIRSDHLVSGMMDLVSRTVGPAISVKTIVADELWVALCDPNQLENALLNLCINARDAMPDGGHISIDITNTEVAEDLATMRDMLPGQYVSLCVSDTGAGMSQEIIDKAFEPFFTTKPIGQGTGLGLSMIYGFAKQSGGQVLISSHVGYGTSVCIYLPRHLGEAESTAIVPVSIGASCAESDHTVLVVDDEPTVRMLVIEVLEDLGYTAIEAVDGAAGLRVLQSDVRIDLLVTDVGLPGGLNGRQVADAARVLRPKLKVLFITGYAESAVISYSHLDPDMQVLAKPFSVDMFVKQIKSLILTDRVM